MPNKTAEYQAWCNMKARCYYQHDRAFKNYGRRGIIVCDRWKTSFKNFLSDMGPRPSPEHSLDRINNSGSYEPGNCRWATATQQRRNTRTTRFITIRNETKTLIEWCQKFGMSYHIARRRLDQGWGKMRALRTPIKPRPKIPQGPPKWIRTESTNIYTLIATGVKYLRAAVRGKNITRSLKTKDQNEAIIRAELILLQFRLVQPNHRESGLLKG